MQAAEDGRHSSLLLIADPGMGSTTILRTMCATAEQRGWLVVSAGAPEGGEQIAFGLVHDVAYSLLSSLHRLDGQHEALEGLLDPARQQAAWVAQALRDELAQVSQRLPVLVALDDLQWADDDSLAVLSLAAGRLAGTRTLVLGAGRPATADDLRLASWEQLPVDPLEEQDATSLLTASLGGTVEPAVARKVVRALACCPLAIVECRRLLTSAQLAGSEPLPDPVPVSPRLQHAWAGLAGSLPAATQRALLALGVIDTSHPELVHDVLRRMGCSEADLDPARRSGLVVEGRHGAPAIAGPLQRAAVLGLHSPDDVRQAHRHVADTAARAGSPPSVVMSHLRRACRSGDADCADELDAQARRAERRNQPEVAARGWLAAARMSPTQAQRADLAVRAGRAWLTESTSASAGEELLALLNDVDLRPRDTVWREWLRAEVMTDRDLHQACAGLLLAARHAASARPELVPWLLWDAASVGWMAGEPATALEAARQLERWTTGHPEPHGASTSTEPARLAARGPRWLAPAVLGTALLQAGATADGVAMVTRAIEASQTWVPAEPIELSLLLDVVALDELMLTDGPSAEQRTQSLQSRLADDQGATAAAVAAIEAWRAWRRGMWSTALSLADDAATTATALRAGATQRTALALLTRLTSTMDSQRFGERIGALRRSATRVGDRSALLTADAAEGQRALGAGDPARAVCLLERVASADMWGRASTDAAIGARVDLVEAYVRCGHLASARQVVDALAPRLKALAPIDPEAVALRLRILALTAASTEAAALFEAAVDLHPTDRCRFEAAHTRLCYSRHLRRTGAGEASDQQREAARVEFERLGAALWARAAGSRRATAPPPFDVLTAQERRVAQLVATGASNRDVADALCLSTRTVESHLASVYRKLGLHRRAQLASLAAHAPSHV